ncbi:MAG: hypothetical protein PUK70_02450 [Bacteroidales bacterium]|nr:hypothetical protein [Bacteroidales bacterium]MDY6001199.1 hypothetical protein [Candidatus Cryptobacteroides sp.]
MIQDLFFASLDSGSSPDDGDKRAQIPSQARMTEGWTFSPVIVRCGAAGEAVVDVVAKYNPCPRLEGREFMGDGIVPPAGL